jgi:hypothetical protein
MSDPNQVCRCWTDSPKSTAEAMGLFDALPGVEPHDMVGRWRGRSLATGHPLDGLLELLGWYGKAFEPSREAHPLLFRTRSGAIVPLDPRLMPTAVALRWPEFARSRVTRMAFALLLPTLRIERPAAKLRSCNFRGRRSTAMVYNARPIIDHFRRVDADRLLGLMERPASQPESPFFFELERA